MAKNPELTRDTTLRDARKMDLLPSVTTFLSDVIAKKNLQKWIKGRVAETGAQFIMDMMSGTVSFDPNITKDQLVKMIINTSDIEVNEAAKFGSAVHDMVEEYALTRKEPTDPKLIEFFTPFKGWWDANVKKVFFAEVTVTGDIYAGRMDLCAELVSGEILIIDWKTRKRGTPRTKAEIASGLGKFATYETDIIQLCAYRKALMQRPDCPRIDGVANIFIDSVVASAPHLHRWKDEDINRYTHTWNFFSQGWCWLKNYFPSVEGGMDVNV